MSFLGNCGCGDPARYETSTGWACNKYMRCPSKDDVQTFIDSYDENEPCDFDVEESWKKVQELIDKKIERIQDSLKGPIEIKPRVELQIDQKTLDRWMKKTYAAIIEPNADGMTSKESE